MKGARRDDLKLGGRNGWVHAYASGRPMLASHRHDELEVNLVLRGWVEYLVDDCRVRFPQHGLAWLLPPQDHRLIDRSDDAQMWIGVFSPGLVRRCARDEGAQEMSRWMRASPGRPLCRVASWTDVQALSALFGQLKEPAGPSERHRAGMTWLLCECWAAYGRAADAAPAGEGDALRTALHPAVERAVRYLYDHAHEAEADDLEQLAAYCGVSRPWLSKLFQEQVGLPLGEFRNRQRLRRFQAMLAQHDRHNLTALAYAAGFGSYAQCFRVVRRLTGRSPQNLIDGAPLRPSGRRA